MAYISTRMPRRLAAGFVIGPRWLTQVTPMDNGGEDRDAKWLYPKMEGHGNFGAFTLEDRQALMNMMFACRGRAHVFRVRNPLDVPAVSQPIINDAGVKRLAIAHTFGSETAYRLIQAPVNATLSGAGSINQDTGVVTGSSDGDTWSGEYDIWMRFDADWNGITAHAIDVLTADIDLIEVRRRGST